MKEITFYLEHASPANKRKNAHAGTVIAVFRKSRSLSGFEAIGAVFERPDSSVASTSTCYEYLRRYCKRISETRARSIHPNLFAYLNADV